MREMFERIKVWYEKGFWTKHMVMQAVEKNILTQDQANEILGGD